MTLADLAHLAAVADRELARCATEAERVAARRMAWALVRAISAAPVGVIDSPVTGHVPAPVVATGAHPADKRRRAP